MASAVEPVPPNGLVLGRYRPLRPLGSGGSGSVWLARDETAGRDVALKIIAKEGRAGPRAEREATAAARLNHPHCLRAYGLEADDKHLYIPYEYVPGCTLRQALRAGDLNDEGAVEAAAQILEGLAFAHARGIVHRDVKPSNVLVTEEEHVSVRLFDFGLAQLEDADTLTAVGDVPGTLAYISPERLHGEAAGPPADVWAVGVLLWEAFAGPPSVLAHVAARDRGGDQDRRAVDPRGSARLAGSADLGGRCCALGRSCAAAEGCCARTRAPGRVVGAVAAEGSLASEGAPPARAAADPRQERPARARGAREWAGSRPPSRSIPRRGRYCSRPSRVR